MLQSLQVKKLMNLDKFKEYMHETYGVLPLLINKALINEFIALTEEKQEYVDYLQKWQTSSRREKFVILHVNKYFWASNMVFLQPYI